MNRVRLFHIAFLAITMLAVVAFCGAAAAETGAASVIPSGDVTYAEVLTPANIYEIPPENYSGIEALIDEMRTAPLMDEDSDDYFNGTSLRVHIEQEGVTYRINLYPLLTSDKVYVYITVDDPEKYERSEYVLEDARVKAYIQELAGDENFDRNELSGAIAVEFLSLDLSGPHPYTPGTYVTHFKIENQEMIIDITELLLSANFNRNRSNFHREGLFVFFFADGSEKKVYTTFHESNYDLDEIDLAEATFYIGWNQYDVPEKVLLKLFRPYFKQLA